MRTFFYLAIVPGVTGLAICMRFLYYYFFSGSGSGHLQSLILAAVLLIMSFLLVMLGILADLISANRRLIQEALFNTRMQMYKKKQEDN